VFVLGNSIRIDQSLGKHIFAGCYVYVDGSLCAQHPLHVSYTAGKGSFGHVQLMKDGSTDKTYALKTVSKMHVVQMGQQEHTASERQVMIMLNHPNIIRLYVCSCDLVECGHGKHVWSYCLGSVCVGTSRIKTRNASTS